MKSYFTYKSDLLNIKQYTYYITYYKYNWHKDIEILIVLDGTIEVNKNGASHIMSKGDIILINTNMGHATMAREPNSIAMVIRFDPIYFSKWIKDYKNIRFKCISDESTKNRQEYKFIYDTALEMVNYMGTENSFDALIYESLFHKLIGGLIINFPPEIIPNNDSNNISKNDNVIRIVDYLNEHFRDKITLDDLAEVTGYNKSYISQVIKQNLGINYYEYLTRIRMREAIFALTNSKMKISDIAFANGFADVKALNTSFKERFGKSPSQYRKMLIHSSKIESSNDKDFISDSLLNNFVNERFETNGVPETDGRQKSEDNLNHHIANEVLSISDDLNEIIDKLNGISLKIK